MLLHYLGKIIFKFSAYRTLIFLRWYAGSSEKSRFWWWEEDADLKMDRIIGDARIDHHWHPSSSQALTRNVCILILSPAEIFPILSSMSNYRKIFEKKNCL